MIQHRPRFLLLAALLLAVAALIVVAPPGAAAGTYTAIQCHGAIGAGRVDASFAATSRRYASSADCDGRGLGITHEAGGERTPAGRFGAWTLAAPAGTRIVRATAGVSAAGDDWHVPQLFVGIEGGARRLLGALRERRRAVRWTGTAGRTLTARLVCSHARSCGRGPGAHVHVRRIALVLRDDAAPAVTPSGSLVGSGSRRGVQSLAVATADAGAGVRTVTVEVNDEPLAVRVLDCSLAGRIAIRLRPCPAKTTSRFELGTAGETFRQGLNHLRVCAADYAPRAGANRTCAARAVRVDNLCPVSAVAGAELTARFAGGTPQATTRSDRPVVVRGRLRTAAGVPVAGAQICVAATTTSLRREERVLAVPATDERGAFEARLPAGPSREVRIAHWPGAESAVERFLTLRSRAVPRLRLSPRRTLRNGERVRFSVRLPRPANGGRRLRVQARAGSRWIRIAGGRTSPAGAWHGRYRFHATTGTQRYAFRAVVPKQAGYPYESGRSRVRHIRVAELARALSPNIRELLFDPNTGIPLADDLA